MILVHGGAGDVSDESIPAKKKGVKAAARVGYATLIKTGNPVDAVQKAIQKMEDNVNFNCGYGSVLTWEGTVEMDASIMNGSDLNAGCCSQVRDIAHPIAVARAVMDKSRHVYMAGRGLMRFAKFQGFDIMPAGSLVTEAAKKDLQDFKDSLKANRQNTPPAKINKTFGSPGTVGAVAIDGYGNVAAATSTGGLTGKMPGRIGDSPILGAGTYADNEMGCVSFTGHGESILKYNGASRILNLIKFSKMPAQNAAAQVLEEIVQRFDQRAGVITIDYNGTFGIYFTTDRMSWAYQRGDELHCGIDKGEDEVEIVAKK